MKEPCVSGLGAEVQDYSLKASAVLELNHP